MFPHEPQYFYVTSQGKIHYRQYIKENGPIICILPGFTLPSALFHPLALQLNEKGFSVLIIDYWGRSFSDPNPEKSYPFSCYSKMVLALLEHLQIKRCSFIGFSFGAAIAADLVLQNTNLVEKLIFLSPFHFVCDALSPLQKLTLGTPIIGPLILKYSAKSTIPYSIEKQLFDPESNQKLKEEIISLCIEQFTHSFSHSIAISSSISFYDASEIDKAIAGLAGVNKNMLIVLGKGDHLLDIEKCQSWWTRWIPNSIINVVDGAGHLLMVEKLDDVVSQILQFFQK